MAPPIEPTPTTAMRVEFMFPSYQIPVGLPNLFEEPKFEKSTAAGPSRSFLTQQLEDQIPDGGFGFGRAQQLHIAQSVPGLGPGQHFHSMGRDRRT